VYRLPSGIFAALIFFIPVVTASSSISLKTAAYIGILVSIYGFLQSLAYPFNLIFLPKFSEYQYRKDDLLTKTNTQTILDFLVTFPLIAGLLLFFMSEEIILLWFGPKYSIVHHYLKILSPSIGFFMAYVLIRGILDGLYDFPYSNIINLSGVLIIGVFSYLTVVNRWDLLGLSISFGAGTIFIGVLSIFILWYKQKLKLISRRNLMSLLWFFILLILFILYSHTIHISIVWYSFMLKMGISSIVVVISFFYYKFLKYKWLDNIKIDIAR
jgi:O-antigen/teichoic acid export membrane protein